MYCQVEFVEAFFYFSPQGYQAELVKVLRTIPKRTVRLSVSKPFLTVLSAELVEAFFILVEATVRLSLSKPFKLISMLNYYVYIVECNDRSYYTGVTNNLEKRLGEHNSGYDIKSYASTRRPVVLKFSQQFHDINQAIALEKQIKGWSRKKKEAFINEEWEELKKLAKSSTEKNSGRLRQAQSDKL